MKKRHPHFDKHLEKLHSTSGEDLHFCNAYYHNHPPDECRVALQNKEKNKYNHWGFPFDHNLIQSVSNYINASPMQFGNHRYIAAQGPRANTLAEFWEMVWSEDVSVIVSVTNEDEKGTKLASMKFDRFWPQVEAIYGHITVKLLDDAPLKEWHDGRKERLRKRRFAITHQDETKSVTHLHMENWFDGEAVHPESLYTLADHVDAVKSDGAITVHCAAGVGRTGTFIAFHSLYHDLLQTLQSTHFIGLDVVKRIKEMRKLRWGAMVGEAHQFNLILKALELALEKHG